MGRRGSSRALLWRGGATANPHPGRGGDLPHLAVDYLLSQRFGQAARRAFLRDLARGRFNVACLEREDYETIIDLDARYADLGSALPIALRRG